MDLQLGLKFGLGILLGLSSLIGCELLNEEFFAEQPVAVAAKPTYPQVRVNITEKAFEPKRLVITPNVLVTWSNLTASVQSASSTMGPAYFDSKEILPNQTFDYLFTKPGTYEYRSPYTPALAGIIIVLEAGETAPPTTLPISLTSGPPLQASARPTSTPLPKPSPSPRPSPSPGDENQPILLPEE